MTVPALPPRSVWELNVFIFRIVPCLFFVLSPPSSVCGLELLGRMQGALGSSACALKLLVYEALSY